VSVEPVRIRINLNSAMPVYRQICDQVRTAIVEGLLAPGAELPGVRRLAIDLGIHFNTVAQAYRTLGEEGWLEVSQGRTVRVAAGPGRDTVADDDALVEFREQVRHLSAQARGRGISADRLAATLRSLAEGLGPQGGEL
jgi:DNA-binding transcriptional regulator YhcF (GntR family)